VVGRFSTMTYYGMPNRTDKSVINLNYRSYTPGGGVCAVEWNAMVGWLVSGLRVFDAPGDDASSVGIITQQPTFING
jgi:hypothetical protein